MFKYLKFIKILIVSNQAPSLFRFTVAQVAAEGPPKPYGSGISAPGQVPLCVISYAWPYFGNKVFLNIKYILHPME